MDSLAGHLADNSPAVAPAFDWGTAAPGIEVQRRVQDTALADYCCFAVADSLAEHIQAADSLAERIQAVDIPEDSLAADSPAAARNPVVDIPVADCPAEIHSPPLVFELADQQAPPNPSSLRYFGRAGSAPRHAALGLPENSAGTHSDWPLAEAVVREEAWT